jgi:hypothetical protein
MILRVSSSLDIVDCENIPGIGHVVFVIIQSVGIFNIYLMFWD